MGVIIFYIQKQFFQSIYEVFWHIVQVCYWLFSCEAVINKEWPSMAVVNDKKYFMIFGALSVLFSPVQFALICQLYGNSSPVSN